MISRTIDIKNPTGLHLRPAGVLCNLANHYECSVKFRVGDDPDIFNAKSIICVLGAGVKYGDSITIICEGADEEQAAETIAAKIESGLEE